MWGRNEWDFSYAPNWISTRSQFVHTEIWAWEQRLGDEWEQAWETVSFGENQPTQGYPLQSQQQLHLHAFYACGIIQSLPSGNAFHVGKHSKCLEAWVSGDEFLNLIRKKQFWKAGDPAALQTLLLHDSWQFMTLICIKTKWESLK